MARAYVPMHDMAAPVVPQCRHGRQMLTVVKHLHRTSWVGSTRCGAGAVFFVGGVAQAIKAKSGRARRCPQNPPKVCRRYEARLASREGSWPTSPADAPGEDILQFDSSLYFAEEDEGAITIDIVRFGSMSETVSVDYRTEDGSAKAGERYMHVEGTFVFEPGCVYKTLTIPLVNNDKWTSTLEFKVRLSNPHNCELGRYLFLSRVKVIDGDYFPSDKYRKEFDQYGCTKDGLRKAGISPFQLLWEIIILTLSEPNVSFKFAVAFFIGQLQNLYSLLTTYIVQYAADSVLQADKLDELLVPGNRFETLLVLVAAYLVPFAALTLLDLWNAQQRLAEDAQSFLQRHIFRMYLNLDDAERAQILPSEFALAMVKDTSEIINSGFLNVLSFSRAIGSLIVSAYFIWAESPEALLPTMAVGLAMGAFIAINYETSRKQQEEVLQREAIVAQVAQDTSQQIQLISDFKIRPLMEESFAQGIKSFNDASVPFAKTVTTNKLFPSWLSNLLVASYIIIGGESVIEGSTQIGTFLGIINIFKDVSSTFQDVFSASLAFATASGIAVRVSVLLNRQTDLRQQKTINRWRREVTKEERRPDRLRRLRLQTGKKYVSDSIPIRLEGVSFAFPGRSPIFNDVTISVAQGKLVAIVGPLGAGKSTLIKLLSLVYFPTEGKLFMPSYLRILRVKAKPVIVPGSIWRNLTIGSRMYWKDPQMEMERVLRICSKLGFSKRLLRLLQQSQRSFLAGEDIEKTRWSARLSISELTLVHLARAFIYNPEVLLMNRPTNRLSGDVAIRVFKMLREFVDNRGVELPTQSVEKRRPRTAFVSFARTDGVAYADVLWAIEGGKVYAPAKQDLN